LRLARYAMARGKLLQQLLQRLATVPETVELARATGLTLPQILYNAQMIRTWSLLLRNAQRQGCVPASTLVNPFSPNASPLNDLIGLLLAP